MTMVYKLHVAYTPKGGAKYGWLNSLPEYVKINMKVAQNPGKSAKSYWPDDFEVEYVYKNKKGDLANDSPYLILSRRAPTSYSIFSNRTENFCRFIVKRIPTWFFFIPRPALTLWTKKSGCALF